MIKGDLLEVKDCELCKNKGWIPAEGTGSEPWFYCNCGHGLLLRKKHDRVSGRDTSMSVASRQRVYEAVDSEREYQESLWQNRNRRLFENPETQESLSVGEFLLLIEEHLSKARKNWSYEHKPERNTIEHVRKIAALAVSCMEQYGVSVRKGI
jgi:hypothetical protein